jgi:hypothetical protein
MRSGAFSSPPAPTGGTRRYSQNDLDRLERIGQLLEAGSTWPGSPLFSTSRLTTPISERRTRGCELTAGKAKVERRPGGMRAMATEDDVRRICLALPGITERPSWGQPAWFARDPDGPHLGARRRHRQDPRARGAGRHRPQTYFWTPHHDRSPQLVLVRLENVKRDELSELLDESYRLAGAPRAR